MTMRVCFIFAALLVPVAPTSARQDTGSLPQAAQWGIQQAMRDLEDKSLGITEETMEEEVGAEATSIDRSAWQAILRRT